MRHPLVPALLFVLLLGAYAVVGVAIVDAGSQDAVTVEGTVTTAEGPTAEDAVVLVGEYGLLTKLSPDELRALVEDDPADLAVVAVGPDGAFAATVPATRADAVVALSDDGVSEVVRLGNQGSTVDLRLHERRPQTVRAAAASMGVDERETRLYVSLHNNGDAAVGNLSVTFEGLPTGWQVVAVETDGAHDAGTRTLEWASVGPGEEASATVTLRAPDGVTVGGYEVSLAAASDTHPVAAEDATVEVRPEETAGPTRTVQGGEGSTPTATGGDVGGPGAGTPEGATPTPSPRADGPVSVPGFGVAAALAALLAALALAARSP